MVKKAVKVQPVRRLRLIGLRLWTRYRDAQGGIALMERAALDAVRATPEWKELDRERSTALGKLSLLIGIAAVTIGAAFALIGLVVAL